MCKQQTPTCSTRSHEPLFDKSNKTPDQQTPRCESVAGTNRNRSGVKGIDMTKSTVIISFKTKKAANREALWYLNAEPMNHRVVFEGGFYRVVRDWHESDEGRFFPIWLETCDECGTESPNCVDQLCGDCYRVVFAV